MVKNAPAKQETCVWSLGQKDPLEKEMATHSSILAWEIPGTEEPGGLRSMGSQKSRTRLSDWTTTITQKKGFRQGRRYRGRRQPFTSQGVRPQMKQRCWHLLAPRNEGNKCLLPPSVWYFDMAALANWHCYWGFWLHWPKGLEIVVRTGTAQNLNPFYWVLHLSDIFKTSQIVVRSNLKGNEDTV